MADSTNPFADAFINKADAYHRADLAKLWGEDGGDNSFSKILKAVDGIPAPRNGTMYSEAELDKIAATLRVDADKAKAFNDYTQSFFDANDNKDWKARIFNDLHDLDDHETNRLLHGERGAMGLLDIANNPAALKVFTDKVNSDSVPTKILDLMKPGANKNTLETDLRTFINSLSHDQSADLWADIKSANAAARQATVTADQKSLEKSVEASANLNAYNTEHGIESIPFSIFAGAGTAQPTPPAAAPSQTAEAVAEAVAEAAQARLDAQRTQASQAAADKAAQEKKAHIQTVADNLASVVAKESHPGAFNKLFGTDKFLDTLSTLANSKNGMRAQGVNTYVVDDFEKTLTKLRDANRLSSVGGMRNAEDRLIELFTQHPDMAKVVEDYLKVQKVVKLNAGPAAPAIAATAATANRVNYEGNGSNAGRTAAPDAKEVNVTLQPGQTLKVGPATPVYGTFTVPATPAPGGV